MKPISVSRADFKHTVSSTYYIDKTSLISKMIKNEEQSILFCRPRRFGKTLNMSMLYYFFSNQEDSKELFQGLDVSKDSIAMSHINKYSTIFLSLKDLGNSEEEFNKNVIKKLHYLLKDFRSQINDNKLLSFLADSEVEDRKKITISEVVDILEMLINSLYSYYNQQVVILIDEYDNAVHHGVGNGYEKAVLDFLRSFLSPVVKDNNKVKLIAFTGILRITKESLFSGMNNLNVCDVLCQEYSEYFGLTEDEVKLLLKDFEQSDRYEEIKMWYNGYVFGNTTIYNPWSTLKSVKSETIDTYWKNTASEEMLENSFLHADEQSKLDIISLYENGKLQRKINMQMTLDKYFSNDIISLLVASGYLNAIKKIDHKTYELEIVNNEIKETYEDLISKYVKDSAGVNEVFVKSLVCGFEDNNLKLLNIELKEIAKNIHYYLKRYEASYHAMLFAMLSLDNSISVKCEIDAGYGRIDLVIYFKSHKCLIEIKKCTQNETIENKFIELTEQIDVKEYRSIMEPHDMIYGIVFANDDVDVRKL